jgi:hypothetical protein
VIKEANRKIGLWSDASNRRLTIDIIGLDCNSRGSDRAESELDAFAVDMIAPQVHNAYMTFVIYACLGGTYYHPNNPTFNLLWRLFLCLDSNDSVYNLFFSA